ncbi:MAG: phosphoribosyl-ATP diphosphatase [Rhodospirillaceae bacterium]|jgi:phosphoribosyl-ATP pyrophosphohydrolase|nr:phosphoribosyl-ATP diphosphatase [Rhodospirillaceae bacterium]
MSNDNSDILERLYAVIESRQGADASSSYSAKLFAAGLPEIARKVGEEAVETITAALSGEGDVTAESADLLYHLLVLWAAAGIKPEDVWTELARREGTSGIEEKNSRGK